MHSLQLYRSRTALGLATLLSSCVRLWKLCIFERPGLNIVLPYQEERRLVSVAYSLTEVLNCSSTSQFMLEQQAQGKLHLSLCNLFVILLQFFTLILCCCHSSGGHCSHFLKPLHVDILPFIHCSTLVLLRAVQMAHIQAFPLAVHSPLSILVRIDTMRGSHSASQLLRHSTYFELRILRTQKKQFYVAKSATVWRARSRERTSKQPGGASAQCAVSRRRRQKHF